MEIIRPIDTEQSIKILPREMVTDVRLILEDKEDTNNIVDVTLICNIENEYLIVPFTIPFFKVGRHYFIRIENSEGKRIWLGEAFCTDQTDIQNYKINGGN